MLISYLGLQLDLNAQQSNKMSQWWLLFQSGLFVLGVYIQKTIRKHLYDRQEGKRIKQTSRIITCTITTAMLLFVNYQLQCSSSQIDVCTCFYFTFDLVQCLHVIITNSLLFSTHLAIKFSQNAIDLSRYSFKSIFAAPFLQQMLFRASFYRSSHGTISTFLMALFFSVSHLHKSVRKWVKGKNPRWIPSLFQVGFTLVFGLYSFWFLLEFKSVVPSIILHCYCNFLGPPSINKQNMMWHGLSVVACIAYCSFVI